MGFPGFVNINNDQLELLGTVQCSLTHNPSQVVRFVGTDDAVRVEEYLDLVRMINLLVEEGVLAV